MKVCKICCIEFETDAHNGLCIDCWAIMIHIFNKLNVTKKIIRAIEQGEIK